ncbi:MAG: AAA family ATPase, partial [Halobacteriovoraceae bacterium]|nr:AAA family ATPase [Halobacteriovoraceae bacterium]
MTQTLSSESLGYLERQEQALGELIQCIRETPRESRGDLHHIAQNIAQLKEEIKVGKEDDLAGLFYQLNIQHTLAKRFSEEVAYPDCSSPYFGHMRLKENDKTRDIFLGHVSFIPKGKNVRIVDWKSAPISRIFYQYAEGEDYELELPGKDIEGDVVELSILTISHEKLTRVDRAGQSFVKGENGWECLEEIDLRLEGGEGSATRELTLGTGRTNHKGPDVIGLLDQEQYGLLNRSASEPLLIIGGAGSGKTTVALHRIASLCGKRKIYPNQVLVIVPHKGLIRLSRQLLSQIGLQKVKVRTGPEWIEDQTRRLIEGIPRRISMTTPLGVTILKRHLSLVKVFDSYLERRERELTENLRKISVEGQDLGQNFIKLGHLPQLERLKRIARDVELTPLQKISFKDETERLYDVLGDLHNIFSSKDLLLEILKHSEGHITEHMVQSTIMHTAQQLRMSDDDGGVSTTLDGRSADEGTPFEARGTVDEEDFALLLYLLKRKTGEIATTRGSIKRYHHLVLDEAQELAPFELMAFAGAIHPNGNATVAGDSAQQVDASISFAGWGNVLKYLNLEDVSANELTVS